MLKSYYGVLLDVTYAWGKLNFVYVENTIIFFFEIRHRFKAFWKVKP